MISSAPSMSTCGRCGASMDPSRAVYDKDGTLVCPACSAKATIAEGNARAVSSTAGSAVGVLVGGVLSMTCFNPFFLVSIVSLLSAIGWLTMIGRNPGLRAQMGGKLIPCIIAVSIGLVLASVPLVLLALGITGAVLSH